MSYTYNKPDATDTISSSQSVIKDNFTAIKGLVDVNHATFGDPSEGKHKIVHFPNLTVTPGSIPAATSASEYALYSTASGLFLRPPSQSAGTVSSDLNIATTYTSSTKADSGYCYLPCGIKMIWTKVTATYQATTTFTYSSVSGFPGFTSTPYSVQITLANYSGNHYAAYYSAISNTSVSIYNPNSHSSECCILLLGV